MTTLVAAVLVKVGFNAADAMATIVAAGHGLEAPTPVTIGCNMEQSPGPT